MKNHRIIGCTLLAIVLAFSACGGGGGSPGPVGGSDPIAKDRETVTVNGVTFYLRYVPSTGDSGFQRDGTAGNTSSISNGYWMGETEVTQELFQEIMGTNPSYFLNSPASGEDQVKRPVEWVNWYDAIAFCNKLSLQDGKTVAYSVTVSSTEVDWDNLLYDSIPTSIDTDWNAAAINTGATGYRLPTEMEWMWAAMGATEGGPTVTTNGYGKAFAGSDESNAIGNYAWHSGNTNGKTHEVGIKDANELGLRDMSGNVWEWCWDWYGGYPTGQETNYAGAAPGSIRVLRGGGWGYSAASCAVAIRISYNPYFRNGHVGFRVVRP
jgi:formylglycine-generating enzyme required for sulfatase activity